MTLGLGWVCVWVSLLGPGWASAQDTFQLRASHLNDADFLRGNDVGLTFRNRIEFEAYDEKDPTKLDLEFRAETEFFTETQPDPISPGYILGNSDRHPYLNYFERTRLSCRWREWSEAPQSRDSYRTFVGHCVELRHDTTDQTDTGSGLQDSVHKHELPADSSRIYAYDRNELDFKRTSFGVGVETGIVWRPFSHLETESLIGCKLQTEGLQECTWGGETTLRFRPPAEWTNERDRREPTWGFYVKAEFEQDFDFKGCDINIRYGAEAAIGLGGNKRLLLDLSCTRPIEIDPSQDRGIERDHDTLIEFGMGISW